MPGQPSRALFNTTAEGREIIRGWKDRRLDGTASELGRRARNRRATWRGGWKCCAQCGLKIEAVRRNNQRVAEFGNDARLTTVHHRKHAASPRHVFGLGTPSSRHNATGAPRSGR